MKSAVKLGTTVILLSALSVALGRTVGVLGIAVTIMAVMLLLAVGLATGTLAGRGRQKDQVVWVPPGQLIPADGEVVDGTALVDESTLTGSSKAVLRESGGQCSVAVGGTRVISGRILVRIKGRPAGVG